MILSDQDIMKFMAVGEISINPLRHEDVRSASVDLHLSPLFRVASLHHQTVIDPYESQEETTQLVEIEPGSAFILHPGQFVLASTVETVRISQRLVARLEGKSSIARLGLIVHTAGFVDPGFEGDLTLEIANLATLPIKLWPGMPIAQIAFSLMSTPAFRVYGGSNRESHYQGQRGPTPSRLHESASGS